MESVSLFKPEGRFVAAVKTLNESNCPNGSMDYICRDILASTAVHTKL